MNHLQFEECRESAVRTCRQDKRLRENSVSRFVSLLVRKRLIRFSKANTLASTWSSLLVITHIIFSEAQSSCSSIPESPRIHASLQSSISLIRSHFFTKRRTRTRSVRIRAAFLSSLWLLTFCCLLRSSITSSRSEPHFPGCYSGHHFLGCSSQNHFCSFHTPNPALPGS